MAAMVTATLVAVLALPIIIDINRTTYSTDIGEQAAYHPKTTAPPCCSTPIARSEWTTATEARNISLVSGQAHFEVTKAQPAAL